MWLAALLVLALPGCRQLQTTAERYPPKLYTRIVSLSPSTTELIATMGATNALVGRTGSCNYPPGMEGVPVVASVKPDYEKIASLQPNLIVYDASLYNDSDIAKLKQLRVELLPYKVNSLKEMFDWIYRFGATQSDPMRFSKYVEKIEASQDSAMQTLGGMRPKVLVVMGGGPGPIYVAGTKGFQADVVRAAGGEPVGPAAERFEPVNAETLVQLAPEVVVTAGEATSAYRDPRLSALGAVRKKAVIAINPDVLLRAGARVDRLIKLLNVSLSNLRGKSAA